jgi:hypothetical protein
MEVVKDRFENYQPIHMEIDKEYLLDKVKYLKWNTYIHKNKKTIDNYKYAKYHDEQIQYFLNLLPFLSDCKWSTSFVSITGNDLEWHTDKETQCAIIWTLKGYPDSCTYVRPFGVTGGGRDDKVQKFVYEDYILDTSLEHKVVLKRDKLIFKISILNKDFNWVVLQWSKMGKGLKNRIT